jgi:isoquinoline 1-oxidoreductase beta subunit
MDRDLRVDRRSFLASSVAASGAIVLGFHIAFDAEPATAGSEAPEINAWIVIRPDNTVVIRVARSEMGQGVFTALAMLVAEELECDWTKVRAEFASPSENLRRHRPWGDMSTGASRSISASQNSLRRAGAVAREMLVAAAAARWQVPASACRAADGVITHIASGRSATFGAVASVAALMTPPAQVKLKEPKDWKLIGTPRKRLDVREKVLGQPVYATDVRLPGMLYAAIIHCPVFGGKLRTADAAKVNGMKGVRRVVMRPDFVAVVADSWWQAKLAADALPVSWSEGVNAHVASDTILKQLNDGLDASQAVVVRNDGDVIGGLARAVKRIDAEYAVPYLAHATMEPQNCTATVNADRVEIWVPTQDSDTALAIAADAAGVSRSKVLVHRTMLGGGFGRRGTFQDYVRQAVVVAKEAGLPVQLLWSREEDIQHDFYRPMVVTRMSAGLDAAGMPIAWKTRIVGQSIVASIAPEMMTLGFDRNLAQGFLADMPYDVPSFYVDGALRNTHVPVGPWRGLDYSQNAFFRESFVDELAHANGQDPYLFRRKLLAKKRRHLEVLDMAARKASWGAALPPRSFRGIAINEASGSICAQVVEGSIGRDGTLRVQRVVSAIDAGYVVNPLTVETQTQSAVVYGLTAALFGQIDIKDGRVEQSNFHDYTMLRMAGMPRVETIIVPSQGSWGGVGEMPVSPLAPALCNGIFAATGKRVRSLPLRDQDLA